MTFTYETQGATTYLVCELDPAEQVDTLTLGMLTNNHINGLAPVLYTEMDGQRFLKYNISAKVTASQFFTGTVNKERVLQAFQNILNALCSAGEYMIDPNCFSVNPDHVFLNVSNCEAALVCIPVDSSRDINVESAAFFKQILFNTQFDPQEDTGFITQMISCLNNGESFTVYSFKDLVQGIASGAVSAQPAFQAPTAPQAQAKPAVPPVSSFDSTISIDDMPGGGAPAPVKPIAPIVNQQPVRPEPQIRRPVPVQPAPMQPAIPTQPQIPIQQPSPAAPKKAPAKSDPGFAIPGQGDLGFAIPGQGTPAAKTAPGQPAVQPQPAPSPAADEQDEKKISFFGLMMHYNKENAAKYKAQKEAEKGKEKAKPEKPPKAPKQGKDQPVSPLPNAFPPLNQPFGFPQGETVGSTPIQQPFPGPQSEYRPPVNPLPVQNSFNETTVLSAIGGETTVLSEAPAVSEPYLTRVKTGERVYINKPVFRIGKEKSYVDFFIADNSAISRSHCNIHKENGECFIEDTNSTNHTYVNGQIINSNVKVKLSNGDKVRLANEDFTFSI